MQSYIRAADIICSYTAIRGSENGFDNGWGGNVVIKTYVGTEGKVKFGVGIFNGTATFSDFNVTTDVAAINAAIAG